MNIVDRIKARLSDLYRELNTGDYDRADAVIFGWQVRVWRTRINCTTKTYLGYKAEWWSDYSTMTKDRLAEMLVHYQGAGTF